MVCSSEVVSHRVKDHGPAEDVVGALQGDDAVVEVDMAEVVAAKLDVAEVAYMAVSVFGMAVVFL